METVWNAWLDVTCAILATSPPVCAAPKGSTEQWGPARPALMAVRSAQISGHARFAVWAIVLKMGFATLVAPSLASIVRRLSNSWSAPSASPATKSTQRLPPAYPTSHVTASSVSPAAKSAPTTTPSSLISVRSAKSLTMRCV